MRSANDSILLSPLRFLFGPSGPVKSRRARIIAVTIITIFILYTVAGFVIVPFYAKKIGTEKLSGLLGRRVSIESISLNPYSLVATVRGFEVKEADGSTTFLSFGSLLVDVQLASIFKKGPIIREVKLEKPLLHVVRVDGGTYNFSGIIDRFQTKDSAAPPEKPGKPFFFSVSNIQIVDCNIDFDDRPAATKHAITQLNLSVPFISNLPSYVESFVQPSLSALVNGTPLNIRGESKVFADSRETSLDISLTNISIPHYLAYAPAQLRITVPSGLLDIIMKATYRQYRNRAPMLVLSGESRIRDLKVALRGAKDEFLRIPLLSVKDISLDLEKQKAEIGALTTRGGWLSVVRSGDGRMNVASIMAARPKAAAQPTARPSPSGSPSLTVGLNSFLMEGYTVRMLDHSLAEPFSLTIDDIACRAGNISTAEKTRGSLALSMRVERKGKVSVEGGFTVVPPSAELAANIRGIPLKPVQPFLAGRTQVLLSGGALNVNGNLSISTTEAGGMNTAFKGKLGVNKLSLLDKRTAEELLSWDSLYLSGMDIRNEPLFAHIREISLSNFSSRILISENRTVNLQEIFTAPTQTPAPEAAASPPGKTAAAESPAETAPRTIRIDAVTLQGGTVNFTDDSITPRFSANLLEIGGRISGLSSEADTTGEVELRGMYDRYAPLEITGKVNPLRDDLYVELRADFKDMDLTSVSPYSGRYAGYTVQKGKLSFRLDYLIVKNKLDAKNNVFLDQFTFGDRVESPEATKLPVRLAVALLKDRNGKIDLDIPVSGQLNDPKFSVGGVVLKVIVNLLVKAATSPFALLSAIFGGNEQIDHAEFEYGSADLSDGTKKKLDILGKALHERPALSMDMAGHADPEKDREGLKQVLLLRRVKSQKIRELAGKTGETQELESIVVTPEEYPRYLKKAYKAEKFPKPRNFIGFAKDLPVPEMEKLMLTNLKVTDEDLRELAGERVRAVRDYLLQSGKVEAERLFVVEGKTLSGEKKEGAKDSRVDFTLK